MSIETINLEVLGTRAGFNSAVRHMNKVLEISGDLSSDNLGDLVSEREDENLSGQRGALLLRMLLVDKLGYKSYSLNLETPVSDLSSLAKQFAEWNGVDLVAAYHHPELGLLIANPKKGEELENFGNLRKWELIVMYAGKGDKPADDSCITAAELGAKLFNGNKSKVPDSILKGTFTTKVARPAPAAAPASAPSAQPQQTLLVRPSTATTQPSTQSGETAEASPTAPPAAATASKGFKRMTPQYSVRVSNELFHNGNVEAWKRIIDSYVAKYPGVSVFIYYEGERILDINTLFKWGKVKHGSAIQFAIAGDEIKDVAKLQRYLAQGASHAFESFLHGPVSSTMKLFG